MEPNFRARWRFAVGLAYCAIAAIALIIWIDASVACKGMPTSWPSGNRCLVVKFFYDWQQLLGGLFALGAAGIGWSAINRQVRQSDEQENERWRRRYDAARAVSPLALSKVHEYASQCATSLQENHMQLARGIAVDGRSPRSLPDVPSTSMAELRAMIEASSPTQAMPIARLLSRIQVQAARLQTMTVHLSQGGSSTTVQYLVDAIEIAALASALFNYARGLKDHPPTDEPDEDEMISSMAEMNLDASLVQPVSAWIHGRYGAGAG